MTELGIGHSLTLLASEGDEIEKLAVESEALAPLTGYYAAIWANYVLPRRNTSNPALIEQPFTDFAELHYTALTRLLCAQQAVDRIGPLCLDALASKRPAEQILAVQASLLTFFACTGAAVENLEKAYEAKPFGGEKLFTEPADVEGTPKWYYDRRTQYLHERLVPVFTMDGLLHVDVSVFATKSVAWRHRYQNLQEITSCVERLSSQSVAGLASGWARMYTHLREVVPVQTVPPSAGLRITSGSPPGAG